MSYTKQQRIQNVKKWSESTLTRIAFCNKEGISTDSLRSWIYDLIGEDKNWWMKMSESDKKKDLSRRLKGLPSEIVAENRDSALVLIGKKKSKSALQPVQTLSRPSVSIDYLGARFLIDENSIEKAFRALKAVNG